MKKLITILFLFFSVGTYATTIPICSGSGTCNVTSMGAVGASPGDVLQIMHGTYTGGNFSNLNGVTIITDGTLVTFTGTVTWGSNTNVTMDAQVQGRILFFGTASHAFNCTGHNEGSSWNLITFTNVAGNVFNVLPGLTYDGTTAKLSLYICRFTHLILNNCDMFIRGSFGDASVLTNWSDSVFTQYITINQTQTNGEEIRGVFFRLVMDHWDVHYSGTNPNGGDVGAGTIFGQVYVSNFWSDGGAGYILRVYGTTPIANPRNNYEWNCLKTNGTRYGCLSNRNDPGQFGTYTQGNHHFVWNSGIVNSHDDGAYLSKFQVLGAHAGFDYHQQGCYAVNVTGTGGNNILQNDAGNSLNLDTSNNAQYATNLYLHGTAWTPLTSSYMRNGGTVKSWMSNDGGFDLNGNPWETGGVGNNLGRAIGPLAFPSIPPPPGGCATPGCSPNRRKAHGKNS